MKKIIGLALTLGLTMGVMGTQKEVLASDNQVVNVVKESNENWHLEEDATVYELKDGSTVLISEKENTYSFYPKELKDNINHDFDNMEDLKNCVITYLEIKEGIKDNDYQLEYFDAWVQEDGGQVYEFTNGTAIVIDFVQEEYVFSPFEMGDWYFVFDDFKEFIDVFNSYIKDNY